MAEDGTVIVSSARFGDIECEETDLLVFPAGLVGLTYLTRFALLPSLTNPDVYWMQSADEPRFALPLLTTRRLGDDYRPALAADDLQAIGMTEGVEPEVFVVINRIDGRLTANLRGPVLINPEKMLARQAVLAGDFDLRHPLSIGVVGEGDFTEPPRAAP
jgi:flagellar assembly factor FliW